MAFRKMRVSGSVAGGLLAVLWACSGGKPSPSGPTPATPVPAPTPTTTPAPTPPSPPGAASCPKGSLDSRCDRTTSRYLADVERAIDQLVQQRPELFNKNNAVGSGGYEVLNTDAYFAGVVQNLQAAGFCAAVDSGDLRIKRSNDFNEEFAILLSSGHVRRGDGAYRNTCSPATFPVDASDHIDGLRVAFYGIECASRPAPRNAEGILPMGCVGHITATPKDKNNVDVPPWIHGKNLVWVPGGGINHIDIEDDPNSIFNKNLYPVAVGPFTLCATLTVDGKEFKGCVVAEVIE